MPSPVILVMGAGAIAGVVDIFTQFVEVRLKRSQGPPRHPLHPQQTPEPLSGQTQDEEEGEEDEDGVASTGYYSQYTEVPLSPSMWDWPRTLRMALVGTIQGSITTGVLFFIQHTFGDDLSFTTALKKASLRLAIGPLFFCIGTFFVESLREQHFRSVIPKLRQDFGTAMMLSLFSFPVMILIYLCTDDVVYQSLLGVIPDLFFSMASNMIMNRGLKAWHPGRSGRPSEDDLPAADPELEDQDPTEFYDTMSATRVSWGGTQVIE
eukprot:GGOE01046315.1.p1 GENE.GGOE01046315.1~~GGOE01046315.1.p1  ORF type:complete len:265 (-),score=68.94 GGOE01046315.1:350-1144(-)